MPKVNFCNNNKSLLFDCPGCKYPHKVNVEAFEDQPVWQYNGNADSPTISPSIRVKWDEGDDHRQCCCHSFVTDGKIQFLNDCTHALAGQTVELPDWSCL
ncbi:DUF6527 family protein [Pelosinus sp. UFO1]|uniref:DUF6527 family protein n=1 Tax=Pelosinus sp. UFO1 TaxID=484770 RepID=UPI0004D0F16F|nr:DUF6527 family protein [Pelosinus sp. UFO1]AIF51990.1 hypothetical protein UFO1_2443 [Pelosinus sp. UFO1]